MEKFGLFRLLSALTGEIAAEKEAPDARPDGADAGAADNAGAASESREALAQPAGGAAANADAGGIFSGEERRRRAEQILARHEAVSRRIDRRGKT